MLVVEMPVTTTQVRRPGYQSYVCATHAFLPGVAHYPRDVLSADLCAHLSSARETCAAHRRADGLGQQGWGRCSRSRVVLHLGRAVAAVDEPVITQAVFQGARNGAGHRRYG